MNQKLYIIMQLVRGSLFCYYDLRSPPLLFFQFLYLSSPPSSLLYLPPHLPSFLAAPLPLPCMADQGKRCGQSGSRMAVLGVWPHCRHLHPHLSACLASPRIHTKKLLLTLHCLMGTMQSCDDLFSEKIKKQIVDIYVSHILIDNNLSNVNQS